MPKHKKRRATRAEKEDWSWSSFVVGAFVGAPFYLCAVGYYDPYPIVRGLSQILVFVMFILGLYLAIKFAQKQRSVFGIGTDGFITGFGISSAILGFWLHGLFSMVFFI